MKIMRVFVFRDILTAYGCACAFAHFNKSSHTYIHITVRGISPKMMLEMNVVKKCSKGTFYELKFRKNRVKKSACHILLLTNSELYIIITVIQGVDKLCPFANQSFAEIPGIRKEGIMADES